ncbi:hypothetical protein EYF80_054717 [Liparis tanakae]|uniref:Uncharacterized protein n=1 Tax=Liparis tanakae TaxID=230148 RepID=A0A4Z2F367_9TELE|nr:hypothetical protein EYF80_054717 [Liparis tanakae]
MPTRPSASCPSHQSYSESVLVMTVMRSPAAKLRSPGCSPANSWLSAAGKKLAVAGKELVVAGKELAVAGKELVVAVGGVGLGVGVQDVVEVVAFWRRIHISVQDGRCTDFSHSPAPGSHSDGAVPAQRQVPALCEGINGPPVVQDDHQVGHLGEEGSRQSYTTDDVLPETRRMDHVSRLSASLAMTMPLPPLAVIMKPALTTEMMASPWALAMT